MQAKEGRKRSQNEGATFLFWSSLFASEGTDGAGPRGDRGRLCHIAWHSTARRQTWRRPAPVCAISCADTVQLAQCRPTLEEWGGGWRYLDTMVHSPHRFSMPWIRLAGEAGMQVEVSPEETIGRPPWRVTSKSSGLALFGPGESSADVLFLPRPWSSCPADWLIAEVTLR